MTNAVPVPIEKTRDLFAKIIRSLVDDESVVRVAVETRGSQTVIRVDAASADIGKLIGKQGRNARALRVLIGEIGLVQGVSYALDIAQPSN